MPQQQRHCSVCNCSVPGGEANKRWHESGSQHQKALLLRQPRQYCKVCECPLPIGDDNRRVHDSGDGHKKALKRKQEQNERNNPTAKKVRQCVPTKVQQPASASLIRQYNSLIQVVQQPVTKIVQVVQQPVPMMTQVMQQPKRKLPPLHQYTCEVCERPVSGRENYLQHINGVPHQKRLKQINASTAAPEILPQIRNQNLNMQESQPQLQHQPLNMQESQPQLQHQPLNMQESQPQLQHQHLNMQESQPQLQYQQSNLQQSQPQIHHHQENLQESQRQLQSQQPKLEKPQSQSQNLLQSVPAYLLRVKSALATLAHRVSVDTLSSVLLEHPDQPIPSRDIARCRSSEQLLIRMGMAGCLHVAKPLLEPYIDDSLRSIFSATDF